MYSVQYVLIYLSIFVGNDTKLYRVKYIDPASPDVHRHHGVEYIDPASPDVHRHHGVGARGARDYDHGQYPLLYARLECDLDLRHASGMGSEGGLDTVPCQWYGARG